MTASGIETDSAEVKKGIVPCEMCGCTRKENICENWLKKKQEETTSDNLTFQGFVAIHDLNT